MGLIESEDSLNSDAFMELAIQEAKVALHRLEVPVGCVIVENRKVIAAGSNRTNETRNATRHAEMEAIDGLLHKWHRDGLSQSEVVKRISECTLFVTCEPCIMCASALSYFGLKEVYFGCTNDKFGGCGSILSLHETSCIQSNNAGITGLKCSGGIRAPEAISLFKIFYQRGNLNAPKPHRAAFQP